MARLLDALPPIEQTIGDLLREDEQTIAQLLNRPSSSLPSTEAAGDLNQPPPILTDDYVYPEHVEDTMAFPPPFPEGYDPGLQRAEPTPSGFIPPLVKAAAAPGLDFLGDVLPSAEAISEGGLALNEAAAGQGSALLRGPLGVARQAKRIIESGPIEAGRQAYDEESIPLVTGAIEPLNLLPLPNEIPALFKGARAADAAIGGAVRGALDTPAVQRLATEELGGVRMDFPEDALSKVAQEAEALRATATETLVGPRGEPLTGLRPPKPPRIEPSDIEILHGKERGVARTVRTSDQIDDAVRQDLTDNPITYNPITNAATRAEAEQLIATNIGAARTRALDINEPLDALDSTVAQLLIKRAQEAGDYADAINIIETVAERATKSGQGIQALNMFTAAGPDGVGRYIQHIIDQAVKLRPGLKVKLTPKLLEQFTERARLIDGLSDGRAKTLETAQMLRDIHELVPPTAGQKISTVQTMAQLLNPKTAIRNIFGNTIFAGFEQLSKAVATAYDIPLSLLTGKRSTLGPNIGAQLRGFAKGARESVQEANLGVNTMRLRTSLDLPQQRTFTTGPGKLAERLLNYELRVPDRAFYQAAVEESLLNQAHVKAINEGLSGAERSARAGELLGNPTKDMLEQSHLDGLYRTFQDDTKLSSALVAIKRALNLGNAFGVGDLVLKYPRTPANLVMRALDYSPHGLLSAAFDVARALTGGKPFNQKAFVEKLGRATVGTAGLTFPGYVMAQAGVLSGRSDKDRDARALQSAEGMGAYRFNVDGFKRWIGSGFTQKQTKQRGDTLISYDWALPMSVSLAIGVALAERGQTRQPSDGGIWDEFSRSFLGQVAGISLDTMAAAMDTIASQPLLRGVQTAFKYQNPAEGLAYVLQGAPASFVPTLLSQINQVMNNTVRETYNPEWTMEALNGVIAKVPVLANSLPDRINVWGDEADRYFQDSNHPWNVFVNPAFVTQYFPSNEAQMLLELQKATGETAQFPRIVDQSLTIDGETYKLTPKEYTDWQRILGQKTREAFSNLAASDTFKNSDPTEQVKYLQGVITELNRQAKEELRTRSTANDPSNFGLLKPSAIGKSENLTAQTVTENFEDKQLLEQYDAIPKGVAGANPNFQRVLNELDAAKLTGDRKTIDRIEGSRTYRSYQRALEKARDTARRDKELDEALTRWRGLEPRKARVAPAPGGVAGISGVSGVAGIR